jgi:hypothetical protein
MAGEPPKSIRSMTLRVGPPDDRYRLQISGVSPQMWEDNFRLQKNALKTFPQNAFTDVFS